MNWRIANRGEFMVDKKSVERVVELARIKVTEEEKSSLSSQLSKIIDYIDKLKEVDVADTESMKDSHVERNIFREDKVNPFSLREEILNNSSSRQGDYFKVPKVIG